jgi:hypothetical protein
MLTQKNKLNNVNYFSQINVEYWAGTTYNSGYGANSEKDCTIEEQLAIPLVEEADKYVCAVERMEVSGNGIYYYSTYLDPEAVDYKVKFTIYEKDLLEWETLKAMDFTGQFYSLINVIQALNELLEEQNMSDDFSFEIHRSGQISFNISKTSTYEFPDISIGFKSARLSSLFGLPVLPTVITTLYPTNAAWYAANSGHTLYPDTEFITPYSRIDAGIIPTILLLRSNLPFFSDQSSSEKVNIVTDLSISGNFGVGHNWVYSTDSETWIQDSYSTSENGYGCLIQYIPQERRWLNFSSPIPITNIRLWIDVVYADSSVERLTLPPGCRFTVKLGLWARQH